MPMGPKDEEALGLLGADAPRTGGMGVRAAAATMVAEIVGTGVLGLAYAGARVGWVLALTFLVAFGLASLFSSMLLAAIHREHPKVDSYQACALLFGGPRAERWTALAINVSWLFILPYYLMASAHSLSVAFWWRPEVCYYEWALASIILLALPAQVRTFEGISGLSTASVAAVALVLVATVAQLVADGPDPDMVPAPWGPPPAMTAWACLDAISSMTFAYQGQSMLLEIAHEMRDARRDFEAAVKISCASLLALYACAMGAGLRYRGLGVASFLPDALPDGAAKTAAGLLLYFHVVVTYLVNNQPLAKKVCDALPGAYGAARWAGVTGALLAWSYLIANLIPWFADFQAVMGSFLGAPIMFAFPVAFYILDPRQRSTLQKSWPVRFGLAATGGLVLPLTFAVGSLAAFSGLFEAWAGDGGVFQCAPSGYAR